MESQRFTAEDAKDAKDAEEERNGSSMEFEHLSFFLCVLCVLCGFISVFLRVTPCPLCEPFWDKEEAQRTSSHW